MKSTKKLVSLLLVAVMAIGMAMTAFAANESMEYTGPTEADKVSWTKQSVYANAKIAAGKGTIAEVTDEKVLASVYDQDDVIWDYLYDKVETQLKGENTFAYISCISLFDVQGITSGEVTVQLFDQGNFKVSNAKGHLAVVSHYNVSTGKWEQMKDLALIDDNGCVTFSFNSYSPIMISVLNIKPSDLKEGTNLTVKQVNMAPQQVVAGETVKAPKMGE